MTKRALVLGGGGTVGIAWETGLAAGALAGGVNLSEADLIVGTSAGSVVGTMLAFGHDPRELVQEHLAAAEADNRPTFDMSNLGAIFAVLAGAEQMTPAVLRQVGGMALAAQTMPEAAWLSVFDRVPATSWPQQPLLVTAVDAVSGEFTVWQSSSGIPLVRAVASSCAVPGLFPPVTIGASRYMDGGVRSVTNADLAAGYESIVIIAPMSSAEQGFGRRGLETELVDLRAAGAAVELIRPDAATLAAFGPNLMDDGRRSLAAAAGVRQGQAAAERLKLMWG